MNEYEYDYAPEDGGGGKAVRGYQVVIIALAVILATLTFVFMRQQRNLKADFDVERTMLNEQFTTLMGEYDGLRTTNDTLNMRMAAERGRVDSIMGQLNSERRLSANKIRQYEKEVATLRTVMRSYVSTIDSLNRLNTRLIGENQDMRQQVTTERLRADKAEESASELSTKVRRGSVVRVRDIMLSPISGNGNVLNRVNRAVQLRVDCVLSANELTEPGTRPIYVRVTGPEGYLLANNPGATFAFEGENRTYTAVREIDYQNQDLGVGIYYNGGGLSAGKYVVEIYMDGYLLGSREVSLR